MPSRWNPFVPGSYSFDLTTNTSSYEFQYSVNKNDTNLRLDNFLMKLFPNLSKGFIFKAIRTNKVKVNGKKAKFDYRLQLNDEIKVFLNQDLESNKKDN